MEAASHDTGNEVEEQDFRALVMAKLVEKEIAKVEIEFDGGGDDGQIVAITATARSGERVSLDWACGIPGQVVRAGTRVWNPELRHFSDQDDTRPMTMAEVLDQWAYELLEDTGLDWVNNEGGFGAIVITPAEDMVRCEMTVRWTEYETSEHEL